MCPTITGDVVFALGSQAWRERARDAAESAARVASAITSHGLRRLMLAKDAWFLDRQLKTFIEGIYTAAREAHPHQPVSEERVRAGIAILRDIHTRIERLYGTAKSIGLTNSTITGVALNSIRTRGDEVLDIAEAAELAIDPRTESFFSTALEDLKNGEVFDLSDFR